MVTVHQSNSRDGSTSRPFLNPKWLFCIILSGLFVAWGRAVVSVFQSVGLTSQATLQHSIPHSESELALPVYGNYVVWKYQEDVDIEAVYALPEEPSSVKGIALLLHACTHSALKFFSPSMTSNGCPGCLGLAEELRIVRLVMARGYIPLALTCRDQKSGCWSDRDVDRIRYAVDTFRSTVFNNGHSAVRPRILAIGASSGGHMAAKVAAESIADAALVMVMSVRPALQQGLSKRAGAPVYLAPMPRDLGTFQQAKKAFESMKQLPIPVYLDEKSCLPLPLTVPYFVGRVVGLSADDAGRIIVALQDAGNIRNGDSMLVKDPTRSDWRDILLQCTHPHSELSTPGLLWGRFVLTPGQSPLAKALHRAWAFHEYCSEAVPPALDFFEGVLKTGR